MRFLTIALIALFSTAGCYKARIHLKPEPPVMASQVVKNQTHFSVIGIIELSAPVNLETACPGGTVTIKEGITVLGGIINIVLGTFVPVLQVMNKTAMCGVPQAAEADTEAPQKHAKR
jgi:hypothetical protein